MKNTTTLTGQESIHISIIEHCKQAQLHFEASSSIINKTKN